MIVPYVAEEQAGFPFRRPRVKVFRRGGFYFRLIDHCHYSLVVAGFANSLQFFIIAQFVRPFAFRKPFAQSGKKHEPIFPQKQAVYVIRVNFTQGADCVHTADGKFVS
jgi:hypothetical protein